MLPGEFSIPSPASEVYVKIEHRLAHLPLTEAEALPSGMRTRRESGECDAASGGSGAPVSTAYNSRVFRMLKRCAISSLSLSTLHYTVGAASRNDPLSTPPSSFSSFSHARLPRCLLLFHPLCSLVPLSLLLKWRLGSE